MWKRFTLYLALVAFIFSVNLDAQQKAPTASDALSLFRAENYAEAAKMYASLLERNDRDLSLNYYYGVCLYKLNHKTNEALRRLKFSATRPVSPDVYYYLGKLYQQIYEMEAAIESFERFLKQSKPDDPKTADAKIAMDDCRSGLRLINKYFDIKVINKDTIHKNDLVRYYQLSKDAGQIMPAGDFFRTGVDANQVIFRTERGNEVYFPILEADETWNIYKIVRLLDTWNEAESLKDPVNSEWDDLFPFMLTDGITLYFSSNRPGGMGGFDIYQSFYDSESRTFSPPANMGPPFNSPADDYLLVPDVFQNKAWFTTNRGLSGNQVVVTEIVWDNSVIKNNTESIHQLRTLASLPINPDAQSKSSSTLIAGNDNGRNKKKDEIRFVLNDTLTYTRYDQFQSTEALEVFKLGYKTELKKDSLNNLMSRKRKAYSQSYNQNELRQLIDEIVELEKQTYGLDNEINRQYINARRLELEKIRQLKNAGTYMQKVSATPVKKTHSKRAEFEKFNLQDFSYYTNDDFNRKIHQLNQMYVNFFTSGQIAKLQQADSLYLWANVLSLESAKVLEQTRNIPATTTNPITRLRNNGNEDDQENPEIVQLIHASREMKQLSLNLYEEALNTKYNIYYPVAVEFTSTSKQTGSEYMLNQASSNFRKAEEDKATMVLFNTERYERMLALKKHSVDMLEESFNIQAAGVVTKKPQEESVRFFNTSPTTTPSYPLLQKGEEGITPANRPVETPPPAQVVPTAMNKSLPEYKVQIGAFRNRPNATALAKIPAVTTINMPDTGLKKYFSGSWKKYAEAQAMVQTIRDAGFPGAFVVAFIDGEQVSIEKARQMEEK